MDIRGKAAEVLRGQDGELLVIDAFVKFLGVNFKKVAELGFLLDSDAYFQSFYESEDELVTVLLLDSEPEEVRPGEDLGHPGPEDLQGGHSAGILETQGAECQDQGMGRAQPGQVAGYQWIGEEHTESRIGVALGLRDIGESEELLHWRKTQPAPLGDLELLEELVTLVSLGCG